MHFNQESSKLINKLIKDDKFNDQFQKLLETDTDELKDLKQVAKVFLTEFNLSIDDWDKIVFLLKMARAT